MIDLNKLANMPGYGRAQEVLRNKGYWREEYTFDDVVDRLENKNVLIYNSSHVFCDYDFLMLDSTLESQLRKAMEA